MSNQSNIPDVGAPFVDKNGRLSIVWWQFLLSMFNRTGGSAGVPPVSSDGSDALAAEYSFVPVQPKKDQGSECFVPPSNSALLKRISDLEVQQAGFIPIPPVAGTVIVRG
jgi:hypothetical protein